MLKILILPLNLPKIGNFQSHIFRQAKFRGWGGNCPRASCHDASGAYARVGVAGRRAIICRAAGVHCDVTGCRHGCRLLAIDHRRPSPPPPPSPASRLFRATTLRSAVARALKTRPRQWTRYQTETETHISLRSDKKMCQMRRLCFRGL